MITVTIPERIMINEDVEKPRSLLWFSLPAGPTLTKTVGPATRTEHAVSMVSVGVHTLIDV